MDIAEGLATMIFMRILYLAAFIALACFLISKYGKNKRVILYSTLFVTCLIGFVRNLYYVEDGFPKGGFENISVVIGLTIIVITGAGGAFCIYRIKKLLEEDRENPPDKQKKEQIEV